MKLAAAVSKFDFFKETLKNNYQCYFLDCGIPNRANYDKRIVGGIPTEVGEFPWQVLL